MVNVQNVNLAAIDIGSNAARLLIKNLVCDAEGKAALRKVLFLRIPLRLGVDVFGKGEISEVKEKRFIRMIKAYKQLMKLYEVQEYRACATSAMRDARNGSEIIEKIKDKTGVEIEIISGDEEAQIVYDNHIESFAGPGNYLYVDVGGGSTEITFISDKEKLSSVSYNVGTLRLLSGNASPDVFDRMREDLTELTAGYENIMIIGSGGNINKYYRLADKEEDLDGELPVSTLESLFKRLSSMSVAERMEVYSLKPDRADVIVPAGQIFLHVARCVGAEKILVPTFGLADGIIHDLATKLIAEI